jgi:hypothetical protein
MKFIDSKSRRGFVNLFADYIVKEFGKDTIIEVIDCGSFIVIKGETPKRELVDLSVVKERFIKENPIFNKHNINIIDLIEYNKEVVYQPRWFTYYPTDRCIYDQDTIDQIIGYEQLNPTNEYSLSITSEFPHGYGLDRGRFEYYFGEYVTNHIKNITNFDEFSVLYDNTELIVEDRLLQIEMKNSLLNERHVRSLLLDVFYTHDNLYHIKNVIGEYDILEDLRHPSSKKPWLIKNHIEDIVVF